MNEYVLKIGGSLFNHPKELIELCELIKDLSSEFKFVIVPGGGILANAVRELSKKYDLDDEAWHSIATLTLNQSAILLSRLMEGSCLAEEFEECKSLLRKGKVIVFKPFKEVSRSTELPQSWEVTSDSIAAYIAANLNIKVMIKLTDVDGVFDKDPKRHKNSKLITSMNASELRKLNESCLDGYIPEILTKHRIKCYVINGLVKERLEGLLLRKRFIGTLIRPL